MVRLLVCQLISVIGFSVGRHNSTGCKIMCYQNLYSYNNKLRLTDWEVSLLFCPKTIWGDILGNLKFQTFLRNHASGPSQVGLPLRTSLLFTPLDMLYRTPTETSAKNPQQISRSHGYHETAPWRLHCTTRISLLDWNSTFTWTLRALCNIEKSICVGGNGGGKNHKTTKIYEGDHFSKITC